MPTVELAASTAVLYFNEGKEVGMKMFAHLGVEFVARAQAFFKHQDQLRLYKSQKRASEVQKKSRKYKAREKVAAEKSHSRGWGLHMVQVNFELNIEP